MMRNAAAIVIVASAADAAKVFLGNKAVMRPDVVAKTLAKVEDEWNLQVASFVECNTSATTAEEASECTLAPHAFQHSCSKVVSAMVAGSDGSKADVSEYMTTVCSEDAQVSEGWRKERCQALSKAIAAGMSDDAYNNRESFDSNKLCAKFWTKFMTEESARVQKEEAVKAAEQKKEEEERAAAEKKAEEEAAAEEKKRAEEAAAEEAKKKEEELKAAKEAKEAEAKALAEKNAKAEAAAAAAEKTLEAVKAVESKEEAKEEAKPEAAPAKEEAAPAQPATEAPAVLAVAKTANVTGNATNATAVKK